MNTTKIAIALLTAGVAGISGNSYAQKADFGKSEYDTSCAVCHGKQGEGDGPYAAFVNTTVSNVTTLAKKNHGVFPFQHVYEVIDGRKMIKAHGERDMPIWGRRYIPSNTEYNVFDPDYNNPEAMVRGRILALTEYVNRLQK